MVINLKVLTAGIAVFLLTTPLTAQKAIENLDPPATDYPYWVEWMQDQTVNFYDVQAAFNAYWEGREITKGSGWKPYKRWEWWASRHIYEDGTRHEADKVYKAYQKYLTENPKSKEQIGDWTNLGPVNVPSKGYAGLGRINAIAFHPTDEEIVYVGAPAGGCWRRDGPGEWYSTTDNLPTLGVSSIVVDWSDPDRVFIGTGDRDAGDAYGMGVFKSEDAGETWVQWNSGMGNITVGRMIQHPDDEEIIYAATGGGIYKTTDAGTTWVQVKTGGYKEVVFKPGDPSTLYVGGGAYTYRSTDEGETWLKLENGIPSGSRSVIAVTEDDPEYVYVLLSNSSEYKGLWRSTDGGDSFTNMSTSPNIMSWGCNGGSGGQAWYDLDVAVDPNDKDVVYAGGVNCFKSTNGGVTWEISSHWWGDCDVPSVHADLHVLEFNPLNDRLYAGNDGGVYYTANDGASWPEITDGLAISQVYRIGQCAIDPDKVINGYQDNGTSTYYGEPGSWETTGGGDGMECIFDHTNAAYSYSTIYYGAMDRHYNNGATHQVAGIGVHGMNEEGGWITPICLHEGDSKVMFAGMKNIWRADDVKSNTFTWKKLTDAGGGNINVVEHSPVDYDLFYYARAGQLYRSDNVMEDDPDWINLTSFVPGSGDILDVETHPHKADVVYLSKSSKIFVSDDRGITWEEITGTLPEVNMNSLAAYINSVDGIYVGTDAGVYYRDASMTDWIPYRNKLPIDASINEIEIYHNPADPTEDVIRAGTYGRGLWSSPVWHGSPVADFSVDETNPPIGCEVNFADKSLGVPTFWEWTFEGGTPQTSIEKNPQGIVYEEEGVFTVTLTVSNIEGTHTESKTGYINVSGTAVPEVYFVASDSVICTGNEVHFTDMSSNCPIGWEWSFDPSSVYFVNGTNMNSQNPMVVFADPVSYSVSLTVTNNAGNNMLVKEDYINIGGMSIPFIDDFEAGSLAANSWSVENPDYKVTWGMAEVAGNSPGNHAAFMNFYEYLVPPGPRDQLVSPVLNLTGYDELYLAFQHAYAKQHTQVTDSLIVKISSDCGETWTRIFEGGEDNNGIFATHELMTTPFVPELESDWCGSGWGAPCNIIDISDWAGNENVKIMFETYNYFGNNLYIDNVMVAPMTNIVKAVHSDDLQVFPNPSHGLLNIVVPDHATMFDIAVINNQGKELIRFSEKDGTRIAADLTRFGAGIYFIRYIENGRSTVQKVVLE